MHNKRQKNKEYKKEEISNNADMLYVSRDGADREKKG
jgi:hypothetical protein